MSNGAKKKRLRNGRLVKRIEYDDFVILEGTVHDHDSLKSNIEEFSKLVDEGKATGNFYGSKWMIYSGSDWFGVDFELDEDLYREHIGRLYNISFPNIVLMMKNYAMHCYGMYVADAIASDARTIKRFLEHYGDSDYKEYPSKKVVIHDFLLFISTPASEVLRVEATITELPEPESKSRTLKHIINYLVIGNEIKKLYSGDIDDETFIKWFPIFFWTEITFILPLRVKEMLVTPYNCIERRGNSVYLTVRRTQLKKRRRIVKYDIDGDYKMFQYRFPDNQCIKTIEKYIEMTRDQKRKYLFKYDPSKMTNDMVSDSSFNNLLAKFVKEKMIGNPDYDYVRNAVGIDDFEPVTAGDSRPIALVNIYFSDLGADICMQLADHDDIRTSEGYFTNIDQIISASSIVRMQNKYNSEAQAGRLWKKSLKPVASIKGCSSPKRLRDEMNLDDCEACGHLDDCIGCSFYEPTPEELEKYEQKMRNSINDGARKMINLLNGILKAKENDYTVEELYYSVQKDVIRYSEYSDYVVEKGLEEWEESKHTQKTF